MTDRTGRRPAGRARHVTAMGLAVLLLVTAGCTGTSRRAVPEDELDQLVIASGDTAGVYHLYARHLGAALAEDLGVPVHVSSTGGSVENLQKLARGEADVAFSSVDAVRDATEDGEDAGPQVRALARIYDDFAHLVVEAGSPVQTVEDLTGLAVSVGGPGSGTAGIADRVLTAAGLNEADVEAEQLGIDASISALRAGRIDAFFWSGGLPTPGLVDLSHDTPIRLIPLIDPDDQVRTKYGVVYRHAVVPDGMYGIADEVSTFAVPNVLVVNAGMPDDLARAITRVLFEQQPTLAERVPAAAMLDRTRAVFADPVPLHPGAEEHYRAVKP